jgi:NAD(P)-dependent dehydrogenase (short-subunit alcohol dehydrogenase family)
MENRFKDPVAVVTGGGSGLGKAIAHRLASEGATVYIFDQNEPVMSAAIAEFQNEGNAGMCAYSTSKSGVIGLVMSLGKEFTESGITINGLAPAVIRTDMVDKMEEAQVAYMTDKIPMKRCGTLEEVSSLACWIVSKEASFNAGYTFDLSGGRATY